MFPLRTSRCDLVVVVVFIVYLVLHTAAFTVQPCVWVFISLCACAFYTACCYSPFLIRLYFLSFVPQSTKTNEEKNKKERKIKMKTQRKREREREKTTILLLFIWLVDFHWTICFLTTIEPKPLTATFVASGILYRIVYCWVLLCEIRIIRWAIRMWRDKKVCTILSVSHTPYIRYALDVVFQEFFVFFLERKTSLNSSLNRRCYWIVVVIGVSNIYRYRCFFSFIRGFYLCTDKFDVNFGDLDDVGVCGHFISR